MWTENFGTTQDSMAVTEVLKRFENDNERAIPNHYTRNFYGADTVIGIQVLLLLEFGKVSKLWLPVSGEGKYKFENTDNARIQEDIYFIAKDGQWYACSSQPTHFIDHNKELSYMVRLYDKYLIEVGNIGQKCKLYVEMATKSSQIYHNYQILPNQEIRIGRSDKNDIVYSNRLASREHAVLCWINNELYVRDCNSSNGLWVNGQKSTYCKLELGDVINILGMNIIVGAGFLSINDGNGSISINRNILREYTPALNTGFYRPIEPDAKEEELFNRLPRRRQILEPKNIKIESPPMPLNGEQIPLMLRMGGSMAMGATSLLSGSFMPLVSSVMFPLLTSKYTEKQKKEYESRRVEKYTEYLHNKEKEINETRLIEEQILTYNYPELDKVLSFAEDGQRLWERRKTDDDFLNIRVGYGQTPLSSKYIYSEERFSLEEDPLENQMYDLAQNKVFLENVPIMCSLVENYVCGISGAKKLRTSLINRMLMQIAMTHSYDEVKMIFLIDEHDLKEMDYIRYLPHLWDDQKTIRFLAMNTADAFQISEYLKKELEEDIKNKADLNEILKKRPYYIIFALDKKIFDSMEVLKDVMQLDNNCGISIIAALDDLPKECISILSLDNARQHEIISLKNHEHENRFFKMDRYNKGLALKSMNALSNTNLKVVSQAHALPKMITFLEMFGVGKIEHLNCAQRWRENSPVKSMATPIGVAPDGSPFMLDLHQKYHGPHGLIAGMTGSGKSEFIITYILSLAVNYRPDEVAFLLIDYKGGGLTSAFEDPVRGIYLPHLQGTITNLDGSAIYRSLISIQSEMTRRQRLFKEAKGYVDESNIDIYSYQKLYRAGKVSEPLPHLMIIADEFAEMKQQEPEFMDSLISIARIGRSLGVHLILATQKPSGVVNDQIRSNTKFRVCLKVQDRSDSMDMLKRPEGAEIKETGRFYLQVGYNELFALGQSSWTGADYEPQDQMITKKDDSVVFVDTLGQSYHEEKPEVLRESTGSSQLSEIVKYLAALSESEGIKRTLLWNEPLPKLIDSQAVIPDKGLNELNVYFGEVDDPAHQKQYSYIYNFMNCNNLLILGAGKCGKTAMVQNILLQLTTRYGADDINYYLLDYSSNLLKLFNKAPHCGAVLTEEDSGGVIRLFDFINKLVDERRQLFAKLEVDGFKNAREKQKIPLILIVIDNIAGLSASKQTESIYYNLNSIMKKASNFGIRFVITSAHLNEVSSRIRQEIGDTIAFSAKDRYEYQDAIGCKVGYTPPELPGRGLINSHGEALEFHASIFGADLDQKQKVERMKTVLSQIRMSDNMVKARKLPSMEKDETYEEFSSNFGKGRIPLGYTINNVKPVALPLKQLKMLSVYFGNSKGIVPIMENFLLRAQFEQMDVTVFARKENSVFSKDAASHVDSLYTDSIHIVNCEQDAIYEASKKLLMEMMEDKKYLQEYCQEQGLDAKEALQSKDFRDQIFPYMSEKIQPRLIIIESVKDICEIDNSEVTAAFNGLSMVAPLYNTYIIHCYSPGDNQLIGEHTLKRIFNKEKMALLFGGCYDKQNLTELDARYNTIKDPIAFNSVLMKYRGNIYEMQMPCGKIEEEKVEQDDASIF